MAGHWTHNSKRVVRLYSAQQNIMEIYECIKDNDYHPLALKFIKNFPVKGEYYTIRRVQHTNKGRALILEEIHNPIMPNGKEPSFAATRFKLVDSPEDLIKELETELEYSL